jgi:alpha-D-ribose 1-methylphosphonate 5-triphosphate synthase subunit PhnH
MSATGGLVRTLTLAPDTAQADFRALLGALARPGTLERITLVPGVPPALTAAAGLADVEVPLCVLAGEHEEEQARALHLATSAPGARLGEARMVVALRPPAEDEIAALSRGDALHPELGARLILAVTGLSTTDGPGTALTLSGPGVPDTRRIHVAGPQREVFRALAAANTAFPAGVDTFLVAADGMVAGLPRSAHISIANGDD